MSRPTHTHTHTCPDVCFSLDLLEVEHVAVEVREDVPLEELLLAVEGELLGADGTDLPVALHVLLEAALLEVRREDHLAQRAALVDVTPGETRGGRDAQECEENDSLGDCRPILGSVHECGLVYYLESKQKLPLVSLSLPD